MFFCRREICSGVHFLRGKRWGMYPPLFYLCLPHLSSGGDIVKMNPQFSGREMKLFIVDEKDAGVRSRLDRIRYNPIRERTMKRRGGDAPGPSGSSRSRLPKPKPASKLSIDELDRELDSYMKTSQHKRVTAD